MQSKRSRSGKASTKKSAGKRILTRFPKQVPAGIDEPRYLKRQMLDGVFYTSAANTVNVVDYSGAVPSWLSANAAVADTIGSSSAGMQYAWSIAAALSSLPNAAEITNLFREYKIMRLDMKIELMCGDAYNGAAGSPLVSINCAYDPSDPTPATSYPAQIQYANNRVHALSNYAGFTRSCVPKPAQVVYSTPLASGYGYTTSQDVWMDCNIPLIPHYAFKCWTRGQIAAAGSGFAYRVTPVLHILMRRPR